MATSAIDAALAHLGASGLLEEHGLQCLTATTDDSAEILRAALALDASVFTMQGPHSAAQRVILQKDGGPVLAAAVVELVAGNLALKVHALAVAKASRLQGYGTVLVTVLAGLAAELEAAVLLVEPDEESLAFWVRLGLHVGTVRAASAALRSAWRQLEQRETLSRRAMARSVTPPTPHADAATATQLELPQALARLGCPRPAAVSAANAARARGYIDCQSSGSFFLGSDGSRQPVRYSPAEELPREFKRLAYHKLQAFDTVSRRGWGLRSATAINGGTIVVEVVGRAMSEEAFEELEELEYVVGFDERTSNQAPPSHPKCTRALESPSEVAHIELTSAA